MLDKSIFSLRAVRYVKIFLLENGQTTCKILCGISSGSALFANTPLGVYGKGLFANSSVVPR